jgi:hypothetical protein
VESEVTVSAVDAADWIDVDELFSRGGDPSTCWCQYFKISGMGWDASSAAHCRSELEGQVRRSAPTPGLRAAVDHAVSSGARVIEGYPVDVTAKPKSSSAALYHGTLSLFLQAGFEVKSTPTLGRAVVSLTVS